MSASTPSDGRIAEENELLAQLGLPPSATPEDVDRLHLAVSQFLAAAPTSVKGWARAQAAALDGAYLQLTDPVGLEGSALKSPTRPPTVEPGGPATPPARRDSVPAVEAVAAVEDTLEAPEDAPPVPVFEAPSAAAEPAAAAVDDTDTDDLDALYASVTPGAHRDLVSGGKSAKPAPVAPPPTPGSAHPAGVRRHAEPAKVRVAVPSAAVASPESAGPWRTVAILASALLAVVVVVAFVVPFVFSLGSGASANTGTPSTAPGASGPTVDMAQVTALMTELQAKPNDIDTLQAIGNVYFAGGDYTDAASFYNKVIAIDPKNAKALLAAGATSYNLQDTATAEKLWKQVVALKPTDTALAQEAHYDLGILYMHSASPDWSAVISEWKQVLAIDPSSSYAQSVQTYASTIAASSMVPASLLPELNGLSSAAPSGSPSGSAAPTGSAVPSGSAAAPTAAASPVTYVVNEVATGLAFTNGKITAPANTPFTIHFSSQDSGVPDDILIKDSAGNTVFKGDMVTGPATVDYQVPALAPGTYTFTSTIHPTTMNGTLVVGS